MHKLSKRAKIHDIQREKNVSMIREEMFPEWRKQKLDQRLPIIVQFNLNKHDFFVHFFGV